MLNVRVPFLLSRVVDALRRHGAFVLGDGTGVGKGRVLAGIACEWARAHPGARLLWVSANQRIGAAVRDDLARVRDRARPVPRVAFESYGTLLRSAELRAVAESAERPLLILDECHLLRGGGAVAKAVHAEAGAVAAAGLRAQGTLPAPGWAGGAPDRGRASLSPHRPGR